jgi:hypothetical protein
MTRVRAVARTPKPALYISTRPALYIPALVCVLAVGCGFGRSR